MNCTTEVEVCITKGAMFQISFALTTSFTEVIANPDDYEGVLVFREYQDDVAPVYLTVTAGIEAVPPEVPASATFTITPAQTLVLPDYDHVAYCNLQTKVAGDYVERLFNAKVEVHE